ncbi:MAG: radical SAM protein [Actinomycetes bacterium]|nr:radical SAM protein [Actinomycetes bacterium]MDX5450663.1 radical SAM protein [Actinomycetes bacterium]
MPADAVAASRHLPARTWLELGWFGLTTVLLRRHDPVVGSLIITDRCNLACQHCAVANIRRINYPLTRLEADMRSLHAQGVRILFLYGGEPFLWRDHGHTLHDVVAAARAVGFPLVNVVTNGTVGLDLPEADLILVSVDGTRTHHDEIRGRTFDRVLANIAAAPADNLCLYMAVNSINVSDVEYVAGLALSLPHARAVSYNIHTPYPGTEHLSLTPEQRRDVCERIGRLIGEGYPVMNVASALPRIADLTAPRPCPQCVIVEDGEQWTCGRCIEIPGLCEQCGFFFAAELSLLFRGDLRVVRDALRMYRRFL